MNYTGMLIKNTRKKLGWSQESLANGICAVSYLSKIEKGDITPSKEVETLLLSKLGIQYSDDLEEECITISNTLYNFLFTGDFHHFNEEIKKINIDTYKYSSHYLDLQLLNQFANTREPIDKYLEKYMDDRQLALQRILEKNTHEAIQLYPCAFTYFMEGKIAYEEGQEYAHTISILQKAYDLAASNGDLHLMLTAKFWIGTCYCNMCDLKNMKANYDVVLKMANILHDTQFIEVVNYNTASTELEVGSYKEAYAYFSSVKKHSSISLHKLAICYEKLGDSKQALKAIQKAIKQNDHNLEFAYIYDEMYELVKYRLEHPNYLQDELYGKRVMQCFKDCKKHLPIGFASFHLPYVIEWYKANRKYKDAFDIYESFPIKHNFNIT